MSVEEWWGRTFENRGSIPYDQMPNNSMDTIQKLLTEDVAELYRSEGVKSSSVRGILAGMELRRRENWTGRAALALSILAIIVSIIGGALHG